MKPLILVTNDDGIVAPGIRALVEVAAELGEVIVVAPDSPQSGKGHAITIHEPLRLNKVRVFSGIEAYECSGTPVDCVKIARYVVLKDRHIDLCVSGINHGNNLSISVLYSGTLSAAMEASLESIRSIGFSLDNYSFDADFEPCKPWVRQIMQHSLARPFREGNMLNVNFPKLPADQIKGLKVCRQADDRWVEKFQEGRDPSGQPYYWLGGSYLNRDTGTDTDTWAVKNGYVAVVPALHDLTNYARLEDWRVLETPSAPAPKEQE
ncbi:MAG TPA: 5'/3'-nucleotidase SurE [Saprospiraceae bacterium]|nr:5'/3'-nucleotidase SurE [Saprospiraceae bacterium]HND89548.1 5'/3'-nucleotidase SurE [Saprospiraceae bacterium]HNG90484.1 5'/3'-nucleotidase SurE [Saprospiraceae bacterium]